MRARCLLSRYRASAGLLFDFNVGRAIVGGHYLLWKIFVGGITHQIANKIDPELLSLSVYADALRENRGFNFYLDKPILRLVIDLYDYFIKHN